MVNQKQAVTNVVLSTFPDYEMGGEVILKDILTTDIKKQMRTALFEAFRANEVTMSETAQAKSSNDAYLTKYVSGLLDNWVRKNKDFNNGSAYVTKNPGSRAGSGDEQIKELRKLLKTQSEPTIIAQVEKAIQERLAEIKPEAVVAINAAVIPEHLKHLVK